MLSILGMGLFRFVLKCHTEILIPGTAGTACGNGGTAVGGMTGWGRGTAGWGRGTAG